MKTILFIYNGECFKLPPFLTILDALCNEFELKVISYETMGNLRKLQEIYGNKVEFYNVEREYLSNNLFDRAKRKVKRIFKFKTKYYIETEKKINKIQYDKLWIIHESTLNEIQSLLLGKKYIFSMYELNDTNRKFLDCIKNPIINADKVIVAEYNRANILRVWLKLNKTPFVVPNKPFNHPRKKCIQTDKIDESKFGKIILYQGHIQETRGLDIICEAVNSLNGYTLLLMGSHTTYRDELQKKYSNVKIVDFVNPPEHLYITSHAYIGIVTYNFVSLNGIYCAPNKTYEYAGFGIPMIANNIPGLKNTIGFFNAGECVDFSNVTDIKNAIIKIDSNYSQYVEGANKFYDDIDIKCLLLNILND